MHQLNIYKDKEEFYQIGLIALWDASKNFNEEKGSFLNFAYMYVKGRMMTEITRNNKQTERYYYPKEEFWTLLEDTKSVDIPLEIETLLSYCDGLTVRERNWVIYHFYYHLKQAEIASLENVTVHAVQRWRQAALRKIRNYLQEKHDSSSKSGENTTF